MKDFVFFKLKKSIDRHLKLSEQAFNKGTDVIYDFNLSRREKDKKIREYNIKSLYHAKVADFQKDGSMILSKETKKRVYEECKRQIDESSK